MEKTIVGLLDITPHERAEFARKDAQEKEQQQRAEEYERDLRARYDSIESDFVPILQAEISAENQTTRVTARNRKDFAKFKQWCEEAGYPYLPADPAVVLEFLGGQVEYGTQYVARLCNAIATLHLATGFDNPCDDVLIRSLLRLLRSEKDQTKPQQKDDD
jgi:hypothetical protein